MKSPKNLALLLLALTTIGGGTLAWRQYQELVALRAAALNTDERADLQKRIWDLTKNNRDLTAQLASQRADKTGEAVTGSRPPGGNPGERGGRGGPTSNNPLQQIAALRDLMSKPEVQALLSVQQKAGVDARYGSLFKSLNLSGDQRDKLAALLVERQTTMMDVMTAASEQGLDPRRDRQGLQKLLADTQASSNASIAAVIGESGLAQLQNYDSTQPQRAVVNQLQQRLSTSDSPLSQGQADQLVQILAANPAPAPQRAGPGGNPTAPGQPGVRGQDAGALRGGGNISLGGFGGGPGGGPDIGAMVGAFVGGAMGIGGLPGGGPPSGATAQVTPAAVNQAQSVLASTQIAALQQIQQQQAAQQQLQQIVRETLAPQPSTNTKSDAGPAAPKARKAGGG
ncbi:MAG: hypothetical protein EXS32_04425 [Opitutus sp.]|nr:hypothetical protein [Opitutus sp.]